MRLLWLTENYPPGRGGMAESCDRIVHGLRRAGVLIDLVHLSRHEERPRIEEKGGGRQITWPAGPEPAHALRTLWNWLDRPGPPGPPSAVAAFGGSLPLLAGPVYAAWLGAPLVVLLRGNDFDLGVLSPRREVLGEAVRAAARVCVVSREMGRRLAALYPGVAAAWVPNGIDLGAWSPLPSEAVRAAGLRQAAAGRRVLGLFGHLKRKKGVPLLLDGLARTGLAGRFHLHVVGEADDEVRALLAAHGELTHALGPSIDRYDLLHHYLACDLLAVPSEYDGLPNVVLEAAALGVPVLGSAAGGIADVVEDGRHGLLFHPGDAAGCAAALRRAAAATPEELARLGAAARARVAAEFSAEAETARYLALLREIAGP